jgi:Rod binding domain-containing protein
MAKNKISGLSEALTEQMKERFMPISESETEKLENNNSIDVAEKVRKNFYIEKHLVKLLRKMAYEEETDQTKIVNAALEAYFKEHKYID